MEFTKDGLIHALRYLLIQIDGYDVVKEVALAKAVEIKDFPVDENTLSKIHDLIWTIGVKD